MPKKQENKGNEHGPPEGKQRRGLRLNDAIDVKRLLNRCINETLWNKMTTDKLRAVSYACQTVLKVFELTTLEQRLARIEEALMKGGSDHGHP